VEAWRLGHRGELDGVRALAVIAVLAGHAGLPGVPRVHVYGVTLFFVLSGFLITSLLLEEAAEHGRIRLGAFYLRRAYRLFPALLVFIAALLVGSRLFGLFDPDEVGRGSRNALLYIVNYARIDGQPMGPLEHLWSLSVEEHFYLVWPAVVVAAFALLGAQARSWLVVIAGVGLGASTAFGLSLLGQAIYVRTENSTETRASGIILGCVLALYMHDREGPLLPARWGAGIGVLAIVALGVLSTDRWMGPVAQYPVEMASITLLGALVLAPSMLNERFAWAPLRRIGRLSYAIYLWHVPVYLLVGGELRTLSLLETVVACAITWGIAEVSMAVVERPFLERRQRSGRTQAERRAPVPVV